MYLKKQKKGQKVYLYLVDNIFDEESGKYMQKIVKSFGDMIQMQIDNPDMYNNLVSMYQCEDTKIKNEIYNDLYLRDNFSKVKDGIKNNKSLQSQNGINVNYAPYVIRMIWSKDLELDDFLSYLKNKSNIKYNIEKNVFFLVFKNMVARGSVFNSFLTYNYYLGDIIDGNCLHTLYKTLDFVYQKKDSILKHLNNIFCKKQNRNLRMLFFDCTNTYFETSYDDIQAQIMTANRKIYARIKENNSIDPDQEFIKYSSTKEYHDELERIIGGMDEPYRLRGPSKELRRDLPLICIALIIDDQGIPVDCILYPGNSSEKTIFLDAVNDVTTKYNIESVISVADNGINSILNIKYLKDHGHGFVIAQSALTIDKNHEAEMLDLSQYTQAQDENGQKIDYFYRILPFTKTGRIKQEDGKYKKISVDCYICYSFSNARRKYDLHKIDEREKKALDAIEKNSSLAPQFTGYKQYCKSNVDANDLKANGLKDELLEKHKKRAGFSAIIFYDPQNEDDFLKNNLRKIYPKLLKIEESFRILKHNFRLRPVYLRSKDRIFGYIITEVISLTILRIIEIKCKENNIKLSVDNIIDALNDMSLTMYKIGDKYFFFNHRDSRLKNNMEEIIDNVKDKIIEICGCTPISGITDINTLRQNLHIRKIVITRWQKEAMGLN